MQFRFNTARWSVILLIALALMIISTAFLTQLRGPQEASAADQSLTVSATQQPDTPLTISSPRADTDNLLSPRITFVLQNKSDKAIRAYAIRYEVILGNKKSGGVLLTNIASLNSVLSPGASIAGTINGDTYEEAVKSITLSVVFVEFVDGTNWGVEAIRFTERLAGQRTGASMLKARYNRVLKDNGTLALENLIEFGDLGVSMPSGHSREWEDGFREGLGGILGRLKEAKKKGGLALVEIELRRQYDASGGN